MMRPKNSKERVNGDEHRKGKSFRECLRSRVKRSQEAALQKFKREEKERKKRKAEDEGPSQKKKRSCRKE
uniref:BZIP domain-containing protein n=2 Tax=Caenorhabditis tropicalis TaxID=1561998 RepID=A0A1I7T365_9PELO